MKSLMTNDHFHDELLIILQNNFAPSGYKLPNADELIPHNQNAQYHGYAFTLNQKRIIYRKAKITPDRPGAFLALWKRPADLSNSKPIPLANEFDYLLVAVSSDGLTTSNNQVANTQSGFFLFPVGLLVKKGIVTGRNQKGKTAFRVFPPWSESRALKGTGAFSNSAKVTQRWQCDYFLNQNQHGLVDLIKLNNILANAV
ncbi:MepB family protein [Pseudoalteromonas sp. TB41]|uniref:MepB family protein n=1 Tax=Pseudoalteromonas sp. TB41 TaxID=985149 RepID=UPI0004071340|nr:MepB family protein [Pseudoalteromonas sp. TB41]